MSKEGKFYVRIKGKIYNIVSCKINDYKRERGLPRSLFWCMTRDNSAWNTKLSDNNQ